MGFLDFLFKKEEDNKASKINNTLKSSFSNVKKDILHVHNIINDHKKNTHSKLENIEERLKRIEFILEDQKQKIVNKPSESLEFEEDNIELVEEAQILKFLKDIPRAELRLFKALYDLQNSLNAKQISYKSLASYLYPNKDYNSIRSTIAQFVLRLLAEGLVEKRRIGKEGHVYITPHGYKILKNTKTKRIIREIEN